MLIFGALRLAEIMNSLAAHRFSILNSINWRVSVLRILKTQLTLEAQNLNGVLTLCIASLKALLSSMNLNSTQESLLLARYFIQMQTLIIRDLLKELSSEAAKTVFVEEADFKGSEFSRETNFRRVQFNGKVDLNDGKFIGDVLSFRNAKFNEPRSQEDACRKAKNVLEKNGDREEAGYHFYREMEGKRKQKPWYIRYPEFLFLQLIFGYGVHPWRLMYFWLLTISIFSYVYLIGDGIEGIERELDYIKISFAIAIAPGYIAAIINPASEGYKLIPMYQAAAIIETIIGTLLWAGFIATFAKKYMK
jgi:hypothetical protein